MILSTIVSYNPDLTELERNIRTIKSQSDKLIIFDNNSTNIDGLKKLCDSLNTELICSEVNVGLGAAYNFVLKKESGLFDYFITFDQDTYLSDHTIVDLLSLFNMGSNIGVVGPAYLSKYLSLEQAFSEVDYLIQSCSIFPKRTIEKVGFFNEQLFIDSVDFEYCLRIALHNFKIIRSNRVYITHNLGEIKKRFGISYIQHNPIRNYYISRNHKFITKKYFKSFPYFIMKKNFFFMIHILKIIFLDQDPEKIKSISKGLRSSDKLGGNNQK